MAKKKKAKKKKATKKKATKEKATKKEDVKKEDVKKEDVKKEVSAEKVTKKKDVPEILIKRLRNFEEYVSKSDKAFEAFNKGDAGIDLYNAGPAVTVNKLDGHKKIYTGISIVIPKGYVGLIVERSSLAEEAGVEILGRVIDSGYRGEVAVILNAINKVKINSGDRIAQVVIVPYIRNVKLTSKKLPKSERGDKGLGSTGK